MLTKEGLPVFLALVVILGFMGLLCVLAFHEVPGGSHDILMESIGGLSAAFGLVVGYYFGSSAGSAKKTELMSKDKELIP